MKQTKRQKIKNSLQKTKERREKMSCKVIECKVDFSTLNQKQISSLYQLFLEGKWLYNSIIGSDNIENFNTTLKKVDVKVLDKFETRELNQISGQMKQGLKTQVFNSCKALKALKQNGHKIGKLKFKSENWLHTFKTTYANFHNFKKSKKN
jgi:putative transposase